MLPALRALSWHLALRENRLSSGSGLHAGLGGLILEGEPGIGKSDLLVKALAAMGLVEGQDYRHIPVSLELDEKMSALLSAFHEGKIVIIDEINSSAC